MEKKAKGTKQIERIPISRAVPGMVLAKDIYSRNEQIILNAGAILDAQRISKIMFYSVDTITVIKQEIPETETLTEQIRDSVEFREFARKYDSAVDTLKSSLNSVVTDNREVEEDRLLNEVDSIVAESSSSAKLFNMIHCIRDYDELTYMHSMNVALICNCFARWLGMPERESRVLTLAGLMHDIGKTMIPREILLKPTSLTADEYNTIKMHTIRGYEMLRHKKVDSRVKLVALQHHERYDRSGYPYGKSGNEIDSFAMIVSIADVYDAMTSDRVYRPRICPFDVIKDLEIEERGKYNPHYLVPLLEQITEVYINHSVRLTDNTVGKIVLLNKAELSKPIVQVDDIFVDLAKKRQIKIEEIL